MKRSTIGTGCDSYFQRLRSAIGVDEQPTVLERDAPAPTVEVTLLAPYSPRADVPRVADAGDGAGDGRVTGG